MPFKMNSDWAKNKKSPDIIYSFVDREEIRYRKENDQIFEIVTTNRESCRIRRVPASEMSIADFDAIKEFLDDSFHEEDKLDVSENRDRVSLEDVENTIDASVTIEGEPKPLTWEDAMKVVDELGLTPAQRRRFLLYCKGLSTYEIAETEGVDHKAIWYSVQAVMKKKEKYFEKLRD